MNNSEHIKEWLNLPDNVKRDLYAAVGKAYHLQPMAVEKDWWVTHTLAIIFSMSCADALVFKGGTSLSRAWNLIERFSEDVDLALDREYLGFAGDLSKKKVHKLRYASYDFLTTKFTPELNQQFHSAGFTDVTVKYREVINHDQDPLIIEIYYPKLTEKEIYLRPGILVEVGSRSLKEPYSQRTFKTMLSDVFSDRPFADRHITIPTVDPERTFLEKVFLLHEEFQRPPQKIRVERLSRHLYDIEKLSQTPYFQKALSNRKLYNTIVVHRAEFSRLEGVDYTRHFPPYIEIVPPENLLSIWEKDYDEMAESMIYGEKLPFNELIQKIADIQREINKI
jgi:hypothetical protein